MGQSVALRARQNPPCGFTLLDISETKRRRASAVVPADLHPQRVLKPAWHDAAHPTSRLLRRVDFPKVSQKCHMLIRSEPLAEGAM
jgi:hypothetical protein